MFTPVIVQRDPPLRMAGTAIREEGIRPTGVWFGNEPCSEDLICRDAAGTELFRIRPIDLVCARVVVVAWEGGFDVPRAILRWPGTEDDA